MKHKAYSFTWGAAATGNSGSVNIYTLYGAPVDNYNNAEDEDASKPMLLHLQYLLGPEVSREGDNGESIVLTSNWCDEGDSLSSTGEGSIPVKIRESIQIISDHRVVQVFPEGKTTWDAVTTRAPCEVYAELMKEALLVSGAGISSVDRKSVVSPSVALNSWLGVSGAYRAVKYFYESALSGPWINEGVCGVDDGQGMKYYTVAASDHVGEGGWDNPSSSEGGNLWEEPTETTSGPVIHHYLDEGIYGVSVGSQAAYEFGKKANYFQIRLTSLQRLPSGMWRLNYRTEGAELSRADFVYLEMDGKMADGSWLEIIGPGPGLVPVSNPINQKWGNSQYIDLLTDAQFGTATFRIRATMAYATTLNGVTVARVYAPWQTKYYEFRIAEAEDGYIEFDFDVDEAAEF